MTRERIPIYDATAPIACSATGDQLADRLAQIGRLRSDLHGIERTEHGMVLRFPNRRDVEAGLRQFALDEKACCQFWGFEVARVGDELTLRWDAPPTAEVLVEGLIAYFEGNAPITSISGLL